MPTDPMVRSTRLAMIGAGFRSASFLSSDVGLLDEDLLVVERSTEIASGSFGLFDATTTSVGSKFFQHVDYRGPWRELQQNREYARVANSSEPVHMTELSRALDALGTVLRDQLGARFMPDTSVEHVEVCPGQGVKLLGAAGELTHARHAVVATGRREILHPSLEAYRDKVELSGSFVGRKNDIVSRHRRGEFASGPVVIVGSSHSAMTALQRLRAVHSAPGTVPLEAVVIQRSPARIMYESLALARARSVSGRERIADELMDVCPSTGIVFRDSGLRHASRDLYYALWAGELPRALLVQSPTDATRIEFLERASVIVQAVGYVPNYPVISIAGRANPDRNVGVLSAAPNGAALVDGQPVRELSVLRVGQTPPELRDRSEYGRNLYRDLRRRLSAL